MRIIAVLLLVGIVAFLVGAGIVYFQNNNGTMSINVDTHRLDQKTKEGVEATKRLSDQAVEQMKEARDEIRARSAADDSTKSTTTTTTTQTPATPTDLPTNSSTTTDGVPVPSATKTPNKTSPPFVTPSSDLVDPQPATR